MFDKFGRTQGYGQTAPGRDLETLEEPGQPGRPRKYQPGQANLQQAIGGLSPHPDTQPMAGASVLQASDDKPLDWRQDSNTGISGGRVSTQPSPPPVANPSPTAGLANPMAPAAAPASSSAPAPAGPSAGTYHTGLMEGAPEKLGNAEHMAKSPKYDFLSLAQQNKYDYTQMPEMLKELQGGPNGKLWQGWTADGKGNFVYAGDPSQLDPKWGGVKRVDAVGSFGNIAQGKSAAGWRWGADDGKPAAQGAGFNPNIIQNAIAGSPDALPTDPNSADYATRLRESIMKALQVNPTLAAAGKQFGY